MIVKLLMKNSWSSWGAEYNQGFSAPRQVRRRRTWRSHPRKVMPRTMNAMNTMGGYSGGCVYSPCG